MALNPGSVIKGRMKALLLSSALLGLLLILASCTREVTVVKVVVATPTPTGSTGEVPVVKEVVSTPTPTGSTGDVTAVKVVVATPTAIVSYAPPAPRTLTVLVGSGQDTVAIHQYFPKSLRIRAGDTLIWRIKSDEIHTVTFLSGGEPPEFAIPVPGGGPREIMLNPQVAYPTRMGGALAAVYRGTGYFNSGIMYKEPPSPKSPPNDSFSLTFDTPGTYEYVDLRHPLMKGNVIVVEPVAPASIPEELTKLIPQVPSQAEIDSQARKELAPLLAQIEKIRDAGETVRDFAA